MRTNIEIDDELLKEAMKLIKSKTKKETVTIALQELINKAKKKELAKYWGSNIWVGDLDKMRTGTK